MEILRSGDAPTLITNVEVMELLSERIQRRLDIEGQEQEKQPKANTTAGDGTKQSPKRRPLHKQLRHRDWVEEQVLKYIQESASGDLAMNRMPDLVTLLRMPDSQDTAGVGKGEPHASELESSLSADVNNVVALQGFGLTDAETLQILNLMPKEVVELHLVIDDLESRLTEDNQNELLRVIAKHAQSQEAQQKEKSVEPVVKEEFVGDDQSDEEEIIGTVDDIVKQETSLPITSAPNGGKDFEQLPSVVESG